MGLRFGWIGDLVGLEIWLDRKFGWAVNLFGLGWAGDLVALEIYLGWKFGWVGLAGGLVRLDWRFHLLFILYLGGLLVRLDIWFGEDGE